MSRILRIVLPALLIVAWVAAGAIGGPYFGRIGEVSSNDQASYLPASAEATAVSDLLPEFSDSDGAPAIVVLQRDGGLSDDDRAFADGDLATVLGELDGTDEASPAIESDDGEAYQVFVPITGDIDETVTELRGALEREAPAGLTVAVTGPAAFSADLVGAFAGIDGLLLGVALAAVFVILLIVYRSPLLPLMVLGTAVFSLCLAILAVWWLAKAEVLQVNGQVQGILFILVIGAATDYALLYVSRYREALRDTEKRWDATVTALRGSFEPILASGGTVIAGLLCLLLSDLNSNKALGPVAAIGIVCALLGALTLLPALLLAVGRAAFWPLRPKFGSAHPVLIGDEAKGLWPRTGRLIARHARVIWIASTVVLLAAGFGITQLKADGVAQSDLILGESPARDGQVLLGEHFPEGSGSPALVVGAEDELTALADAAAALDGVDAVVAVSANSPTGTMPAGTDAEPFPFPTPAPLKPTVVDGQIMLQVTLTDAADSAGAEQTVRELRETVHEVDAGALVGGVTATAVDTDDTSIRDRTVIIPVILGVILLILMALLRSILAPVLLVASVVVSFAAALGVSALVFNGVLGFPGADPAVPLYAFVFLVALGIDYNIFLMTRVREESTQHGTRDGILRGLAVTGGVITSAGIVLAATFAALGVIPVLFLAQLAFIVAFGVLLDTIVVRSLLVPALAHDIGPAIWWPSKLARKPEPVE
ncbi:MAG TPA: efflux RND transporter permease subunit [Pseudolysinimonas sp.]|nr:efflux RND transporter permease subunit [Pseudolysinimonas sp.]